MWNAVLHDLSFVTIEFYDPLFFLGDWRARRNVTKIVLDFFVDLFRYDIAGNDDDRIIRSVVGAEPLVYVFEAGGVEVLH